MMNFNDVQRILLQQMSFSTMWIYVTLSIGKLRPTADDVEALIMHTFCLCLLEHPSAYHTCNHRNIIKTLPKQQSNTWIVQQSAIRTLVVSKALNIHAHSARSSRKSPPHLSSRESNKPPL
jgi:hypothetical protein